MQIDANDIAKLCAFVGDFSAKANFKWTGLPIITFEFADLATACRARLMLVRAISPLMVAEATAYWQRKVTPAILELDCYGVTFRLICNQKLMTRNDGPRSFNDLP